MNDPKWEKQLIDKYKEFVVDPKIKWDFQINIVSEDRSGFEIELPIKQKMAILYVPLSLRRFRTFNFYLKTVVSSYLIQNEGFLLHASSIKKGDYGYVFAGKSGSGKSTVIKIVQNTNLPLNDDFAIIRKVRGQYYVFSSPFYETNPVPRKKLQVPLKGVYFLYKSSRNKVERLTSNSEKISKVMSLVLIPPSLNSVTKKDSNYFLERSWQVLEKFVSNNFFYLLYFKPDKDFLNLI